MLLDGLNTVDAISLSSLFGCKDTNKRAKYQTCLSISQRVKSILMVAVKIRILYISANDFVRFVIRGAKVELRGANYEFSTINFLFFTQTAQTYADHACFTRMSLRGKNL